MSRMYFHHIYLNPFYLVQMAFNTLTQLVKVQRIRGWVVYSHKWGISITSPNPEILELL